MPSNLKFCPMSTDAPVKTETESDVIRLNAMVPMRDGIRLATDIYIPRNPSSTEVESLPVILERTPYDKSGISRTETTLENPEPISRPDLAHELARHGYAVVLQDCRGRYGSEGVFRKYLDEATDGYDTLAWIVRQPWCNGIIGTMGMSYGAHVQCAMATQSPPGLACMFMDSGGFSSAFHGGIRRGGAFEMKQATWALKHALLSPETEANEERRKALSARDIRDWFRDLPWKPGHSPVSAAPEYEHYLFEQWRQGRFSDYWKQPGLCSEKYYDRFPDVPTAIVGSWQDPYVFSCLSNFTALSQRNSSPVTLLMGPWTHGNRSVTFAGDVDFGPQSTLDHNIARDYLQLRLEWFNRWLKPDSPPLPDEPVRYFLMGGGDGSRNQQGRLQHGGCWQSADTWPPPHLSELSLHLDGSGKPGRLSGDIPVEARFAEYRYDPRDPVPTIGGALTSGEPIMQGGLYDQRVTPGLFTVPLKPEMGPLSQRPDVLVFESEPLGQDLALVGAPVIELHVSSDCPDTDFTAKLIDVYPPSEDYPEGYAMNVTDGIFRMRYREGWDREVLMRPGEIYGIRIKPFATANVFKAGHRLRIDISSSNFPHFDINPNSGEPEGNWREMRVARNRVYTGGSYVSRVLLPILELSGNKN